LFVKKIVGYDIGNSYEVAISAYFWRDDLALVRLNKRKEHVWKKSSSVRRCRYLCLWSVSGNFQEN